jgi:peroxiredoxin
MIIYVLICPGFILRSKNNCPFKVLLDMESKVYKKHQVSGIPTKFFIDKNGNIRFKSIGFSEYANQMVKEISAVISILNKS